MFRAASVQHQHIAANSGQNHYREKQVVKERRNDVFQALIKGLALMSWGLHENPPVDFIRSRWWNVQDHMFGYMSARPHGGFTFTLQVRSQVVA